MSGVEIVEYHPELQEQWDNFVWHSRNGTIFHTQRFIGYHPPSRFEDCSLLFKKRNKILAVLPAAIGTRDNDRIFQSHPGSSYGGPVLAFETGLKLVMEILEALIDFLRSREVHSIEMRLPPRIYQCYPSEDLDFSLTYLGFKITSTELSTAICLNREEKEWWNMFRDDTARSIRKTLKSRALTVMEDNNWEKYWQILEHVLKERHSVSPTHSLEEIVRIRNRFPDRIKLVTGYVNGDLAAGIVFFVCNDKALHTFYFAQEYRYQKDRVLNLILYKIMKWGQEHGASYLNLGISTEDSGNSINWGLFRFKEGFGARGVVRRYYVLRLD